MERGTKDRLQYKRRRKGNFFFLRFPGSLCLLLVTVLALLSLRGVSDAFVTPAAYGLNTLSLCNPTTSSSRSESSVATSEADDSGTESNSDLSTCPFVKRFPRYRVDLSPAPRGVPQTPFTGKLLGGFQSSWNQRQLKQQGYQLVLGMSDLVVFCFLWTKAVELVSTAPSEKGTGGASLVRLAFPESQPQVIRNWLDLLDWIQDFETREGVISKEQRIRASFSLESDVPCLVLSPPSQLYVSPAQTFPSEVIDNQTRSWVQRVLVDLAICPFTKSKTFSGQGLADVGVPVGRIAYHTSSASSLLPLLRDIWQSIHQMIQAGPKGRSGVSSILLAAPAYNSNFDVWSGPVFGVLEASVVACRMESQVGVVCFHPQYATPDGTTFPGFGHMHSLPRLQQWFRECTRPNKRSAKELQDELHDTEVVNLSPEQIAAGGAWQRRTPHATVNVLRADQLQAAESRRNTPQMYTRNIQTLMQLGNDRLRADLEKDKQLGLL
jgi:hypothetical protein